MPAKTKHRHLTAKPGDEAEPPRLIGKPEVLDRVGVTFATIWKWQREGTFPRGREVGGKTLWVEDEINEWVLSRPIRRLKGDGDKAA